MPLQITGPVTFVNGQPTSPAATALIEAGFDPSKGGGYGRFVQDFNQREAAEQLQPAPPVAPPSIAQAVKPAVAAQDLTAGAQQAANVNLVIPTVPPPVMQSGPIQQALGLPPTVELANRYRYNPPWRL